MNRRAMRIVHGALAGLIALCAVSAGSAFAAGGKLVIADAFPPTAGWALETDDAFVPTRAGCLEALARVDFDGALVPALATGWQQVSPTEWDVTIREGVKFHNGEALDAAAVAGALNHVLAADAPARAFSPTLILALTITGWTPFARMSRGLALEVNARDYIAAAEVLGCTRRFIVLRHLIPNLIRPISAIAFLRFGHKLPATVGGLSFLGLGVQPATGGSDWGAMLARHRRAVPLHGAHAAARDRAGPDHIRHRAERDDGRAGAGDRGRPADGGPDGSPGGGTSAGHADGGARRMTRPDRVTGPISRTTLSGQVTARLRDGILAGRFGQGEQLNEAELAREFGVSRGPTCAKPCSG